MSTLLQQLKKRRLDLGFKQSDMMLRIGVSRQQYQRLESKGNPRLDTLELIAKGLNSEIMLIPKEKLRAVHTALEASSTEERETGHEDSDSENIITGQRTPSKSVSNESLLDDPWQGLLGDES